jgi:hypothetical protein
LLLGFAAPVLADEDTPEGDAKPSIRPTDEDDSGVNPQRIFDLPRIDYPALQAKGLPVSLYVDHTYETTSDLSTFWWVHGRGDNYRVAVGGTYQLGALNLYAELPVQYTRLRIDRLMELAPKPEDMDKAAFSLADIITGVTSFWELPIEAMRAYLGLGLRVRWPTHTTRYTFGLVNGDLLEFGFPYYLHVAPAVLLAATSGSFFLTVNQGVLGMLAKDVTLGDIVQRIPNLYFWESHVAAGLAASNWLALSLEVMSCVQLNRVDVEQMTKLNNTKAVFLIPGITLDLGSVRLGLAGRIGMTGRSSRDFGVITFSGAHAFLTRLSYVF